MRVLLTNTRLVHRSGSNLYLYDVARWLRENGHTPIAYSVRLGALADQIRRDGIDVIDDLSRLGEPPDVIHGHHHLATATAIGTFPGVPVVAFCHGRLTWEERPLRHPSIRRYVAVSRLTRERLVSESGIAPERVRVIPDFVDVGSFRLRAELPERPRRALLFSNRAQVEDPWVKEVRAACSARGITLDVVGLRAGNPIDTPERLLGKYDLVFGRGRCALEAMASGTAVIVCDVEGLASLATPAVFDYLRDGNFGVQVLRRQNERSLIGAEIDRYEAKTVREASMLVRSTLAHEQVMRQIFRLYEEAVAEAQDQPVRLEESAAALVSHLTALDRMDLDDEATARARMELEAFKSGLLVRRLLMPLWRMRQVLAPSASSRHRLYLRLRGRPSSEAALAGETDYPSGAEVAMAVPADVRLATAVLAVGAQPGLPDAVASLNAQSPRPEIVVVASGEGAAEGFGPVAADVVHTSAHLMPGAARNLGIAATSAPYVAFLAADCTAQPGWLAGRLAAHAAGAAMVSSAVINDAPANVFAVAAHGLLFSSRLPHTPRDSRQHYGASYDRRLFEQHGRFRDDLRTNEDTEFHARVSAHAPPVYRPDVCAAHRNPRSLVELLADQYARGALDVAARGSLYAEPDVAVRRTLAANTVRRVRWSFSLAWRASSGRHRARLILSAPFLLAGGVAYAVGALTAARPVQAQPAGRRLRLVCLIQFHNERHRLAEFLENVSPHVDGIIALDDDSTDGSATVVEGHPGVIELLRIRSASQHVWDEPRNRRVLVDAAIRHGAEWAIAVDADERLERDFRQRADIVLAQADREAVDAFHVVFRELWDSPLTYRVDGVWGQKRQPRLFRVPAYYDGGAMALHGPWAPDASRLPNGEFARADLIVYHLAMIEPAGRQARRAKYRRLDPQARWQRIGYDYLTSETGLQVQPVSPDRDYAPLPQALVALSPALADWARG